MDPLFNEFLGELRKATEDCREDMHEPDEQGIDVVVAGYHLDNAFCSTHPRDNCGEFSVGIKKDGEIIGWFNLASLIALARKAVL